MDIRKNDFINIDYVGKTEGKIFDLTDEELAKKENIYDEKREYGPVTIVVGAGHLIKGIDESLIGKKVGEEFETNIEPEKAFGKKNPKLLKIIPEKIFKNQEVKPHPGMTINVDNAVGYVISVSAGRVIVDFNHPLAGKELNYKIKVNKKIEDKKEQIQSLMDLFIGAKNIDVELKDKKAEIKYNSEKEIIPQLKDLIEKEIKKYVDVEEVEIKKASNDENKDNKDNG